MKKVIIAIVLGVMLVILTGCMVGNRNIGVDWQQTFNRAYIKLGDDWQKIVVKSWRDFDNGDEVQIVSTNDITYLTHYSNVVLYETREK